MDPAGFSVNARGVIRGLVPPLFLRGIRRAEVAIKFRSRLLRGNNSTEPSLFDGSGGRFMELARSCNVYAEYGVGQSTIWVGKNSSAHIVAVDSSQDWLDRVKSDLGPLDRLDIQLVDVGEIGKFGRPIDYSKSDNFIRYMEAPWERGVSPDLVLIDGRFRVACFLTSLLRAEPGTWIVFDDYLGRAHYHIIEKFVRPHEFSGRQAIFRCPSELPVQDVLSMRGQFINVMD